MMSKSVMDDDDSLESALLVDLEDIPPRLLRKMLRSSMTKRAKKLMDQAKSDDDEEEDDSEAEDEREKLANMVEESRGESPKVPVTKDDFTDGQQKKLAKKDK